MTGHREVSSNNTRGRLQAPSSPQDEYCDGKMSRDRRMRENSKGADCHKRMRSLAKSLSFGMT